MFVLLKDAQMLYFVEVGMELGSPCRGLDTHAHTVHHGLGGIWSEERKKAAIRHGTGSLRPFWSYLSKIGMKSVLNLTVWIIASIFRYMMHGLFFFFFLSFILHHKMLEAGQWENMKETLFLLSNLFLCVFIVIASKPESKIRLMKSEQTSRIRELALEKHLDFALNLKHESTEFYP